MNKQLTKKTIGIAASAALMASAAFSGSALAGPGGEKGPPPPKQEACDIFQQDAEYNYVIDHACADTLRMVSSAILGATTVNERDTSSLLNKVCEAHFKFEADKLGDAYQKLWDIKTTIESKKKVSQTDQDSISDEAEEAANKVVAGCP
jgi:hypothetical protein